MARIYKRGQRWGIDYVDRNGKRRREMIGTKDEALVALREEEHRMALGDYALVDNSLPLTDLAEEFMRYHKLRVRPSTYGRNEGALANLMEVFSERRIDEISLADLDEYCDRRLSENVTSRTVNIETGLLRQMLRFGEQRKLIASSPMAHFKPLKVRKRPARALEPEEVQKILEFSTETMYPVFLAFVMTGMRKGELINLRWKDVDLDGAVIHLRCRDDWQTKNGEDRDIDIPPPLLMQLRKMRLATKKSAEYVFETQQGTQRHHNLVSRLRSTAARAGVEDPDTITIHSLRHTFATQLARQGVHPSVAQGILGHKDSKITMEVYTHANERDRKDAMEGLNYGARRKSGWHKSGTNSDGLSQRTVG